MEYLIVLIVGVFVGVLAPIIFRLAGRYAGWLLALFPAALTVYFIALIPHIESGNSILTTIPWVPSLGINFSFVVDGLALVFALMITGIGVLIFIYAQEYLEGHPHLGRFYFYLTLFMLAMLGVVLADNVITLFVFWELTSLSSYFLIGFNADAEKARKSALQALLVTGIGGLALLAGLLLIANVAGSMEMSVFLTRSDVIRSHPIYVAMLLLVLAGAFTKSAQFPFHFWLPNAMEAPTPVSAYLHSATMVKAGVYLLARFQPLMSDTGFIHDFIIIVGSITMLWGAAVAFVQKDLKLILAYSTISALGTLTLLIGLGTTAAAEAAIVFLLGHSLYKGALFLIVGAVDHETGTRNIEELGGLTKAMPTTAMAVVLAGLSMSGIPPMLGFLSKELMYEAKLHSLDAAWLMTTVGVVANVLLVSVAAIVVVRAFFGKEQSTPKKPHEAPLGMLLGPVMLSVLGVVLGMFPGLISSTLIAPAVSAVRAEAAHVELSLWHGFNFVFALSLLTFFCGLLVYVFHKTIRSAVWNMNIVSRWNANRWYGEILQGLINAANVQTKIFQNGYLRWYLLFIIATTVGLAGVMLFSNLSGVAVESNFSDIGIHELTLAVVMIAAALMAIRSKSRIAALVALGIVGYGIALLFILFGAPDLAMTQFAIETLTVILFVLVVYRLPRFVDYSTYSARTRDAVVALSVGGLMTALVMIVSIESLSSHVSAFFSENSFLLAKGRNIVNVILVDFRGLDTMGEITVLAIAAIGAYALLKLKKGEDT